MEEREYLVEKVEKVERTQTEEVLVIREDWICRRSEPKVIRELLRRYDVQESTIKEQPGVVGQVDYILGRISNLEKTRVCGVIAGICRIYLEVKRRKRRKRGRV